MVTLRQLRSLTISLLAALFAVALAGGPSLAADITTPFAGKAVNGGTVTHEHRDGRHMLRVSDDFKVPGSPDPHWQVVDSKGWCRQVSRTCSRTCTVRSTTTW